MHEVSNNTYIEIINRIIDKTIMFLFINALLIDTINGFLLRKGLFSIGQPIRLLLFYMLFYRVLMLSVKSFFPLFVYYLIFMMLAFLHFYFYIDISSFLSDLAIIHKFIIIMLTWVYVHLSVNKGYISKKEIVYIFLFNIAILSINLILGVVGVGFSQYSGGIGSVGFFYAGNEVSGSMICLFSFVLIITFINSSLKRYFFIAILLLFLSLIKVTKVAILGTFVLMFFIPTIGILKKYSLSSIKLIKFFLMGFALFFIVIIIGYYILDALGLFNRLTYFYYYVNSGDLISTLLSGRDKFIEYSYNSFVVDYNFLELVVGKGVVGAANASGIYAGRPRGIEIDVLDFLVQFGFIGMTLLMLFVFSLIRNSYIAYRKSSSIYSLIVLFTNLLLFLISLLAGHIYNSAMAGVFIGILNGLVFSNMFEKTKNSFVLIQKI